MTLPVPAVPASGTAVANVTGQNVNVVVTGGTVQGILVAYNSLYAPPAPVTPAIPASTVTATNTNAFPVAVAIVGGTVTVVAVNGVTRFTATGVTVVVPPSGTVAITYSVIPTSWTWSAVKFGSIDGNPMASPQSAPMGPNDLVTLLYSAAPTWAWSNPLDIFSPPGYAAINSQTGAGSGEIPALPSSLPLSSRSMGGQAGLGVAESN